MKKIPVTIPYFTEDEEQAVVEALKSGWVAQGPRVEAFEKEVARHEGVEHGIATTSCTTALQLAMMTSEMQTGFDVIAPSFTFVATINSIVSTGATPILVDVDPCTYNIDVSKITQLVERQYKHEDGKLVNKITGNILWGIVAVHQFGLCCDIKAINQFAKSNDLKVIEDAACALGAKVGETHEGGFGNLSCISFHPRKSITTGEGGMVLTNDRGLASKMKSLRSHGSSVSADMRHAGKGYLLPGFEDAGYNYRMTDIQGAIGLEQIKKLDVILKEKRRRAELYDHLIRDQISELIVPYVPEGYYHTYQSYVCMLNYQICGRNQIEDGGELRNELLSRLEELGIATRQGTHAVHTLGYYKKRFGFNDMDLPASYACDRLSITLPMYMQMTDEDQIYIVDTIKKVFHKIK